MKMLYTKDLTKRFGGLVAVNSVSIEVNKGEFVALIGPNGSGKTTFFNVVTGVYNSDGGEVFFKDENITNKKSFEICKKGIGRTFQITQPFQDMTVIQNVMVGAIYGKNEKSISLKEAREKAHEILEFTGLIDIKDTYASDLTIGNKKRLELSKALATKPELLLLDEVMGGLNTSEMLDMMKLLEKVNDSGITLLMIEHVMRAVMSLAERIYVLNHGQLISHGTPEEVSNDEKVIECYLGKGEA